MPKASIPTRVIAHDGFVAPKMPVHSTKASQSDQDRGFVPPKAPPPAPPPKQK
jgi:hypothetical protein